MKTESLARILAGERPTAARRHLAARRVGQLSAMVRVDKRQLVSLRLISRQTIARLVADCRAVGLAPIDDPLTLADVAEAVHATSSQAMARLLWVLNSSHLPSADRVEAESAELIASALTAVESTHAGSAGKTE